MRNQLPDLCFSTLASTGDLIVIKCGERGYYPSDWSKENREENKSLAAHLNWKAGVNEVQRRAMECGSMAGWDVPGANPQIYFDEAQKTGTLLVRGHIKHPTMGILYSVKGKLRKYKIMGSEFCYLPMDIISTQLMGKDSDFILRPDLIAGDPLIPVVIDWAENGSCTMKLEPGSFSYGKELNSKYQIIAKVQVGGTEIVMGEHPKAPSPFVTWERTLANDKEGPPNYYWGHYFTDRDTMIKDFCYRAKREYRLAKEHENNHRHKKMKTRGESR